MNILLLNHYAGSPALGMEYRSYYLAREWVRAGHQVHIMAANFSHVRTHQPAAGNERVDGIAYRWFATPAYQGNGLGRMRNIVSFMSQVWRAAPEIAAALRPGVVIASSTYPLDNWVARRIAQLAQTKLVYEVHDLWPLSLIELSGMSPWHPFALLCQAAEDAAYRHSNAVVSMLPKVQDHMASRGLDLRKLTIVPNGISPDDWAGPAEPLRSDVAQTISAARAAGQVVVGYAGSMGLPNALGHLLDAAKLLAGAALHIVLVGDGHERGALAQRVNAEGLRNVTLHAPIPKAQVRSFLGAIDIAYIGWQRVPLYRFGIAPNKLMDYMMAGCAVLHSVQAGNDPVAESGCGVTVAPEDAPAIAAGLRSLAALPAGERAAMGLRGREFVLRHHSYPVLAARFMAAVAAAQ